MRKQFILSTVLAAMAINAIAQDDVVLMTINGKDVTKSEFEYIYHKNNTQQADTKSLEEYMPLFINYKLKVDAAEKAGIDTTSAFVSEFNGYRDELAKPYLTDLATEERLLQEAYSNLQKNVEISHILINTANLPHDSLHYKAREKALDVLRQAREGGDFAELARMYSDDPGTKLNEGYLGYLAGGRLIYPFEKVAFSMNPGEISDLVETRFGYHIIKVHNVRPDRGEYLSAHIFFQVPRDATPEIYEQKKAAAEAAYQELLAGADFAQVVNDRSEDRSNVTNGGALPWCKSGDVVKEYEETAFSLEKGAFSAPVKSPYGFHIVKLLDRRNLRPYEEMRPELVHRIARDERGSMGREALIDRLKAENNYVYDEAQLDRLVGLSTTNTIDSALIEAMAKEDVVLVSYADTKITAADLAVSLEGRRFPIDRSVKPILVAELRRLSDEGLLEIEKNNLPKKYPEYRNLINEYRDGILLFEISNREVWEKAASDIKGLEKFFKKNKKKYAWDAPRFKGLIISCKNDTIADEVKLALKKMKPENAAAELEAKFNNDSVSNISVEVGLYAEGDNDLVDELVFGGSEARRTKTYPVVFTSGKTLTKPEAYIDVRGQVTADYQEYLEELWVKRLNKQAKVVKNEDVLKTIK